MWKWLWLSGRYLRLFSIHLPQRNASSVNGTSEAEMLLSLLTIMIISCIIIPSLDSFQQFKFSDKSWVFNAMSLLRMEVCTRRIRGGDEPWKIGCNIEIVQQHWSYISILGSAHSNLRRQRFSESCAARIDGYGANWFWLGHQHCPLRPKSTRHGILYGHLKRLKPCSTDEIGSRGYQSLVITIACYVTIRSR